MLNYAYTAQLAQMQIQAIADGDDPTIGIMHHGRRDKSAFIFDVIEPERPKVRDEQPPIRGTIRPPERPLTSFVARNRTVA